MPMKPTPSSRKKVRKYVRPKPKTKAKARPTSLKKPRTSRPACDKVVELLGVHVVAEEPNITEFSPATLDHVREAYDSVNRGTYSVGISRNPKAPENYVLLFTPRTPTPEFGGTPAPTPTPQPRITITDDTPTHPSNSRIQFGPPGA